MRVPAPWTEAQATERSTLYTFPALAPPLPMLSVEVRALEGGDAAALLERLVAEGQAQTPSLQVWHYASWSRRRPGAVAVDFTLELPQQGGAPLTLMGTTAVTPLDAERALVVGVAAAPGDWSERRWDVVRAVEATRR